MGSPVRMTFLLAAIPALAFSAMHRVNPSMTGILSFWSTGLSLYLPRPLYALSLYFSAAAVLVSLRQGSPVGWAILLLAAGGYAPQMSTQLFLGLIALSALGFGRQWSGLKMNLHSGSEEPLPGRSSPFHPRRSEA